MKLGGQGGASRYLTLSTVPLDQYLSSNEHPKKCSKSFMLRFYIHQAIAWIVSNTCKKYGLLPENSEWNKFWKYIVDAGWNGPHL
jgi:hypothetical protein